MHSGVLVETAKAFVSHNLDKVKQKQGDIKYRFSFPEKWCSVSTQVPVIFIH